MRQNFDLHVHTVFSDGESTPEEVVTSALDKGLAKLGFSDHSYTSFDTRYCIAREKLTAYREEISRLKEKYRGRIEILCGIEQDYYSDFPAEGYDYIIGSVHYLYKDGKYLPIDEDAETLRDSAERYFGGDAYALVEAYYDAVADVACRTHADIIGHFDLVTKFIEKDKLFDTSHPRYVRAWQKAADALLSEHIPFEINVGAITRGCRTSPYPSDEIMEYLTSHGAGFVYSSDSHAAKTLAFFNEFSF